VGMHHWGRGGRRGGSERAEQSCGKGARTAATETSEGAESAVTQLGLSGIRPVQSSFPLFAASQRRLQ